ncbi:hypothetical protein JZ751_012996 [Albula glossodonta]|uniref:Uncharacterized protein n=1 Tax=Albula glossodonta TaxID=121402 RepID=A0A8T2MYK5_9TELE|nr:hypothetical protein JZ751_012996 [Albula glossodonta]
MVTEVGEGPSGLPNAATEDVNTGIHTGTSATKHASRQSAAKWFDDVIAPPVGFAGNVGTRLPVHWLLWRADGVSQSHDCGDIWGLTCRTHPLGLRFCCLDSHR